jgi:signal peptidase I
MAIRPNPIVFVRRLVDGAIVVLVAGVLICLALSRLLPLAGNQTLIVGGPSMEPAIPLGSIVILDQVAGSAIRPGDVVTVRVAPSATLYTHRVTRLLTLDGQPYIETKGDANPGPDGATVRASAVVGRVALSVPFLGYLLTLLTIPVGVLFVLGLGAVLVLAALLLESLEEGPVPAPAVRAQPEPRLEGRVARHLGSTRRRDRHAVQRPR